MWNSSIGSESSYQAQISPTHIITHICWDNLNDLNEEAPSWSETTHSAHGKVIQETIETDRNIDKNTKVKVP